MAVKPMGWKQANITFFQVFVTEILLWFIYMCQNKKYSIWFSSKKYLVKSPAFSFNLLSKVASPVTSK